MLIILWISEHNVLPPTWISSAGIRSVPVDLYFPSFSIAIYTSRRLDYSATNGLAVCISVRIILQVPF